MRTAALIALNAVALGVGLWVVPRQRAVGQFVGALVVYLVAWLIIFAVLAGRVATIGDSAGVLLSFAIGVGVFFVGSSLLWRRRRAL